MNAESEQIMHNLLYLIGIKGGILSDWSLQKYIMTWVMHMNCWDLFRIL